MLRSKSFSIYWLCQLAGWSLAALYWSYNAFADSHFDVVQGLADFVLDVIIGIGLTHGYRALVLRWGWLRLDLKALLVRLVPSIIIVSALYSLCIAAKLYGVRWFFMPAQLLSFTTFFTANGFTLFITGTRLLAIWVLAYHLYHYAQREIAIAHENARLSVIAKEAQLGRLAAQLNPHFFFNSLNTIKFLIASHPTNARRSIDLLSGLLRHTLYTPHDTLMPLAEELGRVNDYLELERLRFEERLHYTIGVPDNTDGVLVPPFCIQTLVENALKHGIDRRKVGGHISVTVLLSLKRVTISVCNTGTLIPGQTHTGLGLQNLRGRLHLHYGAQADFILRQKEADVVEAELLIPR